MSVIRIEQEDPVKENPCTTCTGTNRLLHGYVYDDEDAHGVYFLEWCDGNHLGKAAFLTIGLGAFSEDSDASDRTSVCIEWRREGMRLTDKPARDRPELLGALADGHHRWARALLRNRILPAKTRPGCTRAG